MILIYRFSETIPIAIGKFLAATSCSYLQQPSLSPTPQLPSPKQVPNPKQVPSPKSQVPSPKSGKPWMPWMPWCRWSPLVLHQQPGPHSFILPHMVNRVSVVPHMRADRSCGSSTLEAYWLQLRAASVKIDLQQPRSEVNLYVKFYS